MVSKSRPFLTLEFAKDVSSQKSYNFFSQTDTLHCMLDQSKFCEKSLQEIGSGALVRTEKLLKWRPILFLNFSNFPPTSLNMTLNNSIC